MKKNRHKRLRTLRMLFLTEVGNASYYQHTLIHWMRGVKWKWSFAALGVVLMMMLPVIGKDATRTKKGQAYSPSAVTGYADLRRAGKPVHDKVVMLNIDKFIDNHDGDTVTVKMGNKNERVRFLGVDTFEMDGDEKKKALKAREMVSHKLFLAKEVWLEVGLLKDGGLLRDTYDRLLGYVYYKNEAGEVHCINDEVKMYDKKTLHHSKDKSHQHKDSKK